ncbi:MAG TPA: rhomboid family intramembrane serine protease [Herpetosiphonaceae bacterium]|nr:rhomboid family intramembrane serine protease [Herpetosiphonaceae bacterium]
MSRGREPDELGDVLGRLRNEFGDRPDTPAAGEPVPGQVEAYAQPAARGSVRLQLPLSRLRIVYLLLGINVAMYALTMLLTWARQGRGTGVFRDPYTLVLYQLGAKYGPAIDAGEYWRFLTPIVLHGGLVHLLFNSYALYALGPMTEGAFGSGRFLAIYLLAGLAGSIASYMTSPGLSIGASGAIFGLIGALGAFYFSVRSFIGAEASRRQIIELVTMAGINIFIGLSVPAVDNAAHIGGLVMGTVAGLALAPGYRIDDRLYPPAVVRTDRPTLKWMLAAALLIVLVAWAVMVVGRWSR